MPGRAAEEKDAAGGWPSLGSCVSKLEGSLNAAIPPFVGLAPPMGHPEWGDTGQPGFLGVSHAPFKPSGDGKDDMVLNGVTIARRLVEAGARVVTLAFSRWDHHGKNFDALKQATPMLDQGVSALIDDLY